MDSSAFRSQIMSLNGEGIVDFINANRHDVKLLFINANSTEQTHLELRQVAGYLAQLNLPEEIRDSEELQFLYLELGLYFKTQGNDTFVSACNNNIVSNVLKNRLEAWLSYRQYTNRRSHAARLPKYLEKLSLAISDGEAYYDNEVIRDLHNYLLEVQDILSGAENEALAQAFSDAINSPELIEQFPILTFYAENKAQFYLEAEINPSVRKLFEPTIFSQRLFDDKFTRYIKTHPKTIWYNILLGIPQSEVRDKIIGKGQTNFDKAVEGLQGLDIVKLYAHCNMRMHFFSSLYLFERLDAFLTLYNSPGRIKFIDIGCGPATAGLSFIEYLYRETGRDVSFDYIGVDYYQNMLDGAAYFLDNDVFQPEYAPVFIKELKDLDFTHLENANSIMFNTSYLFASENLDPVQLAVDVMNVRRAKPTVPCYLLFQNSILPENSAKYIAFKKALGNYHRVYNGKPVTVRYSTQRNNLSSTSVSVNMEILLIE